MPFSYRDETRELNELTRQEASGSFVQLSDGFTHYELSNPLPASPKSDASTAPSTSQVLPVGFGGGAEGGGGVVRDVVLAHGFSVPYFIYDPTFDFLNRSGFRVLRYDLYGRGFSDRPDTPYDIDLFVRQLGDLLDALSLTRPVSLVGLSTGGPITAAFTARFPERVDKLVLIDPVGAKPFALGRLLKVAAMPFVGETIISLLGIRGMTRISSSEEAIRTYADQLLPRYIVQMQYKGFKRAILSTIRNNMLGSFRDVYEQIGKMGKPVLLLWGKHDHTVPFKHSNTLQEAIPNLEFHAIEHCGHIPHYEKPDEVNPILLQFLKS
ncbi:MAG: alpha/beta fold hydrolase [Anaerolineales bacterium]